VNTDDRDVDGYLKLFTFLSKDDVTALLKAHEKNPAERQAQQKLAADLTDHVHGEHARQAAVAASAILFDNLDPTQVGSGAFDVLAQEIPTVSGENGLSFVDAVVRAGLAKSKSEARRSIAQGGIYVNQERVQDADRRIAAEDWIGGKNLLLRKGKKDYALVRLG
jgi:tyrosyl-tRNA synthetase